MQTNTTELLNDKVALVIGGSGGIGSTIKWCKSNYFRYKRNHIIIINRKIGWGAGGFYKDRVKSICINVTDVSLLPEKIKEAFELFADNKIDI